MVSFVIDTVQEETTEWYQFGRESLMTCLVEVSTTGLCPCTQLGSLWKRERLGLLCNSDLALKMVMYTLTVVCSVIRPTSFPGSL